MSAEKSIPHPGRYQHRHADGRMVCDVCPRHCALRPGQRGFCFVREGTDDSIALTTYGRSSGFCIDPIEKKPLYHFLPGTSVLSFGTAGCNLGCKFCQNWDISKAKHMDRLQAAQSPTDIANLALSHAHDQCQSVAFTYNDPVIFIEYAIDTAEAVRAAGLSPVAVTAGYIAKPARADFFAALDAVNVDLKAFTQRFYRELCAGDLEPVKETLRYIAQETDTWLEVTTLLIPGENDDPHELNALCAFVADELGKDVPLHFSAFHPDYKLQHRPKTSHELLQSARDIAKAHGLRYVYLGNVHDPDAQTTSCPGCSSPLIQRDWFALKDYRVTASAVGAGACPDCGETIAGRFGAQAGDFGRRRIPLRIL